MLIMVLGKNQNIHQREYNATNVTRSLTKRKLSTYIQKSIMARLTTYKITFQPSKNFQMKIIKASDLPKQDLENRRNNKTSEQCPGALQLTRWSNP